MNDSTYEWHCVKSVPLTEWPLEDSPDGQATANKLTERHMQWVRSEKGDVEYKLMKYVGEVDEE